MDQTQLQQKIAEYYSKLPPKAQEAFSSMAWLETLKQISTKYGLSGNQVESLSTETTLMLLGIINTEEYIDNLEKDLSMTSDNIDKLVAEINDTILKPILPELEQSYNSNIKSMVEVKYGSEKSLDERFATLPTEVQSAIRDSNYQEVLYSIAQESKLTIEQMGNLEEVTNKVLLGIIHPDLFEKELSAKLAISPERTAPIVNEINDKILKNIRSLLKSQWAEGEKMVSQDEEVPIPPYAHPEPVQKVKIDIGPQPNVLDKQLSLNRKVEAPSVPAPVVSAPAPKPIVTAASIYQSAGVEIGEDIAPQPRVSNLIASKLGGITLQKPTTSDYSRTPVVSASSNPAPKPPLPPSTLGGKDPYHESID